MIVIITGFMGSGKTYMMTLLGKALHDSGRKIYSNYNPKFSDGLVTKKDIMEYGSGKNEKLVNCALLLDEIQTIMDCRTSQKNRIATYFVLQTRKRDVDLIATSQQFGSVDKRIRMNTEYVIEMERIERGDKLEGFKAMILRHRGKEMLEEIKQMFIRFDEEAMKLYDTYEIVDFDKE